MLFKDTIDLVTIIYDTNDIGNIIETRTSRTIFADIKSIKQSEFYQAAATGLKPEITFEILTIEYNNEITIEHNSKVYSLIRFYNKNDERTELICAGNVGTEVR